MKWIKTQKYKLNNTIYDSELRNCEYLKNIFVNPHVDSNYERSYIIYTSGGRLGKYSTKEKAQKVYEMIFEFLNNKNETMFVVPQDDEVKDE